jgi:hypothetical protein
LQQQQQQQTPRHDATARLGTLLQLAVQQRCSQVAVHDRTRARGVRRHRARKPAATAVQHCQLCSLAAAAAVIVAVIGSSDCNMQRCACQPRTEQQVFVTAVVRVLSLIRQLRMQQEQQAAPAAATAMCLA